MLMFPPLMLLVASAVSVWRWRPVNHWPGASASLFMAALLGLVSALTTLIAQSTSAFSSDLLMLLQQATLFAGVPLIAAVWLADAAGQRWDRVIWGRVLLGICAVFELCRRADRLDEWLLTALMAGLLGSVFLSLKRRQWVSVAAVAGLWGAALAAQLQDISGHFLISLALMTALLRTNTES
ncbi:MAG: hypothetical protein CMI00_11670 [Oceanospirillaceae bacterium]|nr:hypothetical protein [Oceanospirillaceae bacterium]|tara:strand:- start:455 stop:1000 length:546 start_codon:yes stop_codon:yes gene_type:complete